MAHSPSQSLVAAQGLDLTAAHWGVMRLDREAPHGRVKALLPWQDDPDPSPIGPAMLDAYRHGPRILRPAVRRSWLDHGPGGRPERRGREGYVQVSWEHALDLVAAELARVRGVHGNEGLFAGSYGWSSAGRFHHAQSQLRRFMNGIGGFVRQVDTYSLGAGRVVMPHIVADMDTLMVSHSDWQSLAAHTRLFVSFGGVPQKNAQISAGGVSEHHVRAGLAAMAAAGCRFVNFSPVRSDLDAPGTEVEWIPIRPGSDVAVMLALATEVVRAGRHDRAFLQSHCQGFERWERYLLGLDDGQPKTAEWAAPLAEVSAERLRSLALDMAREVDGRRTLVNVAWSLQRADHGEQAFWATVGLAAVIGHIGKPGGGFGLAYGSVNVMGSRTVSVPGPTLPMGDNPVASFIPCARLTDMLLHPGAPFEYNGGHHRYPDARLVYWVGGNPFHHHQDLNRLAQAWARPETIVVHEQVWNALARRADIVLPATSTLEREDIGYARRDPLLVAMRAIDPPPGEARDDHAIFAGLARRLGTHAAFTQERNPREWLAWMWQTWRESVQPQLDVPVPSFDEFWRTGWFRLPQAKAKPVTLLGAFREDPQTHRLKTPSGRIELFSERVDGFGYAECPGHPAWLAPAEWLGAAQASRWPLHLVSDQPVTKLHSQLDFSSVSRAGKIDGREAVWVHPQDAAARGITDGDTVELFNDRGRCLAGARVTDQVRPGVLKLSTGGWWDPADPGDAMSPCRHGNPNVLTRDAGASRLSQGCSAQSCLVELRLVGTAPAPRPFEPPALEG